MKQFLLILLTSISFSSFAQDINTKTTALKLLQHGFKHITAQHYMKIIINYTITRLELH